MINKRRLIKNLLANNDEGTFFDKKVLLEIHSVKGKASLLKNITALSNSNPANNAYLVFGVEDKTNKIIGQQFVDDSDVQNLVNSYLANPPIVRFENIYFPKLTTDLAIGLLTIRPQVELTTFKKGIWKIVSGQAYFRQGSNSMPVEDGFEIDKENVKAIEELEKYSSISMGQIIKEAEEHKTLWLEEYNPRRIIFKEQFIVCWSGYEDKFGDEPILSEVDIRIINDDVRLFFSAIQKVRVEITDSTFKITEYINMGFDDNFSLHPYEETLLTFYDNGRYSIDIELIFKPPKYDEEQIEQLYKRTKRAENNWLNNLPNENEENWFSEGIAQYYLVCYLNGIDEAKNDLIASREYLDGSAAEWQDECMEILKKMGDI